MMGIKCVSIFAIFLCFVSVSFEVDDELFAPTILPFHHELEEVAKEFQGKLRQTLADLEMEMYEEFLKLLKELDNNQENITKGLTEELSQKVAEVMGKFQKVMAYSTERTQELDDKMKGLFHSLVEWAERGVRQSEHLVRRKPSAKRRRKVRRDNTDRSKRHTGLLVPADGIFLQDISAAKKLLELDPEDIPITEGMDDLDAFLDQSFDFDGDLEIYDSDFILREFAPGTKSKYILKSLPIPEGQQQPDAAKNVLPRNCFDLLKEGNSQNGVYFIHPSGKDASTEVWCNQESDGGGWTTIINRLNEADTSLNFTTTSDRYNDGFGSPSTNHWIGLEVMHVLTQGRSYSLRVLLEDVSGNSTHATYGTFRVGSKDEQYTLQVEDYDVNSTAADAFSIHSGKQFVYPIPASGEGCSHNLGVGWWYLEYPLCFQALATGQFQRSGNETGATGSSGMEWTTWRGNEVSLRSVTFMIRPTSS